MKPLLTITLVSLAFGVVGVLGIWMVFLATPVEPTAYLLAALGVGAIGIVSAVTYVIVCEVRACLANRPKDGPEADYEDRSMISNATPGDGVLNPPGLGHPPARPVGAPGKDQEREDYVDHELPPTWRTGYAVVGMLVVGPLVIGLFLILLMAVLVVYAIVAD